jgi:hypothetical protein
VLKGCSADVLPTKFNSEGFIWINIIKEFLICV